MNVMVDIMINFLLASKGNVEMQVGKKSMVQAKIKKAPTNFVFEQEPLIIWGEGEKCCQILKRELGL